MELFACNFLHKLFLCPGKCWIPNSDKNRHDRLFESLRLRLQLDDLKIFRYCEILNLIPRKKTFKIFNHLILLKFVSNTTSVNKIFIRKITPTVFMSCYLFMDWKWLWKFVRLCLGSFKNMIWCFKFYFNWEYLNLKKKFMCCVVHLVNLVLCF